MLSVEHECQKTQCQHECIAPATTDHIMLNLMNFSFTLLHWGHFTRLFLLCWNLHWFDALGQLRFLCLLLAAFWCDHVHDGPPIEGINTGVF